MYGVPETELTSVSSVTVANMRPDVTRVVCNAPKSVTPFTCRAMYCVLHVVGSGQQRINPTPSLDISPFYAGSRGYLRAQSFSRERHIDMEALPIRVHGGSQAARFGRRRVATITFQDHRM
jgi:hypothetical protein